MRAEARGRHRVTFSMSPHVTGYLIASRTCHFPGRLADQNVPVILLPLIPEHWAHTDPVFYKPARLLNVDSHATAVSVLTHCAISLVPFLGFPMRTRDLR